MESLSVSNKQKTAKLPEQVNINLVQTSSIMYNNSKKYSMLSYEVKSGVRETLFVQSPLFDGIVEVERYNDYMEMYFAITQDQNGLKFMNFINSLEQRLIHLAFENKTNWFKNKENIKFRSVIKNLDDDNDTKIIKFRMPYNIKTKRIFVDSLDNLNSSDNESINISDIKDHNGQYRLIINVNAIWFTDDMFGLYLRPVYVEEIRQCEYQFQDQYGISYFIDSEIPNNNININSKKEKCMDNVDNVNKLNTMLSSFQEELNSDKVEIRLDNSKTNQKNRLFNAENSESLSDQLKKTNSINKKVNNKSFNVDISDSDSEIDLDYED
jgi:hypothetical protein